MLPLLGSLSTYLLSDTGIHRSSHAKRWFPVYRHVMFFLHRIAAFFRIFIEPITVWFITSIATHACIPLVSGDGLWCHKLF